MSLRILHQDEYLVIVDKPAGFHVHPPEDDRHRIPVSRSCLHILRDQLGKYVYPVHRLDGGTSGALLFALSHEVAGELGQAFSERRILKSYVLVARGWVAERGVIDAPLDEKVAQTRFERLAQLEIPEPLGRYSSARFSLVRAEPVTGRMHQIRRHFANSAHPLLGDTVYGDGKQNRFFRERLGISGLMLQSHSLRFKHPVTGTQVSVRSRWGDRWHRTFDRFGVCPV